MAYDWNHGKSRRAVHAEAEGKLPATRAARWARQTLGIRGCTAADVRHAITPCEWHHVSKKYNRVDFYDTQEVEEQADELREAVASRKRNSRPGPQADVEIALASFAECGLPGDEYVVQLKNGELAVGTWGGGRWSVRALTPHEHSISIAAWLPGMRQPSR